MNGLVRYMVDSSFIKVDEGFVKELTRYVL